MNTDNRFPLEDCFKAVDRIADKKESYLAFALCPACHQSITTENNLDKCPKSLRSDGLHSVVIFEAKGQDADLVAALFSDPGDEHGAHETLEEESDMERDRR